MATTPCPLCNRDKYMRKAQPLYGQPVCKKCRSAFANRRQIAYVIDSLLIGTLRMVMIIAAIVGYALLTEEQLTDDHPVAIAANLGSLAVAALFFGLRDSFAGQSPGKMLMGVQTLSTKTGRPASVRAGFARNFPLLIPFTPLLVAVGMMKGPRLFDGWANTKVIWRRYADHPIFKVDTPESHEAERAEQILSMAVPVEDGNPYRSPT